MLKYPDPKSLKVQLNTPVSYERMNQLSQLAEVTGISKARMVRDALEKCYPLGKSIGELAQQVMTEAYDKQRKQEAAAE